MKTTFIYSLSDPDTREIRYIGKANNIQYRLWSHIHEAKNDLRNMHKCNWIKTLLKEDKKPVIEIIEEVSLDCWKDAEIYWIAQFKVWGFNLINKTAGGECGVISENCKLALSKSKNRGHQKGVFKHSEETKAKIRAKRALQVMTDEHKEKISIKMKGVQKSDEHKQNISVGKTGKKFTEEHIKNIVKSRKQKLKTI
jgi:hypothetical protein